MPTNDKFNLDGFKVDENDICTADGGFVGDVSAPSGLPLILKSDGASISILDDGSVRILSLPTSDPGLINTLWNDSGTVKVSTGA